jgi:hypothetical protein
MSGEEIPTCAQALAERGILGIDIDAIAELDFVSLPNGSAAADGSAQAKASCAIAHRTAASGPCAVLVLLAGLFMLRRRSGSHGD